MDNKMKTLQTLRNRIGVPAFGRGVWAVAMMYVIGSTGFATAYTYLSLYLYQERHIPMTLVGVMYLASGISSAVSKIFGGITGDRFGYRKMVVVYSILGFLASAAQAVLIRINAPTWSVVVVWILVPTLGGMAFPSLNAIIANVSPKGRLTEAYGLMTIAGSVGWVIGPLLGGHLLGLFSYGWLVGFGAAMQALGLIGILFVPAESDNNGASETQSLGGLRGLISNKTLIVFSLLNLVFFLTTAQWGSSLSVFTVDRLGFKKEQYGLLLSISALLVVVFQYPVSHRIQSSNLRRVLVLACLTYGAGFLSFAWVKAFLPALAPVAIAITAEMLFIPTALGVVGRISRPEDRGRSMGIYGLCQGLGFSFGPLLGGFLLDKFPETPLLVWGPISLCPVLAAIGFALWKGVDTKEEIRPGV